MRLIERLSPATAPVEVWRAIESGGAVVAVKRLTPAALSREDLVARFRQEAAILARLGGRHHVVGLRPATDDPRVIVMEWAAGGNLRRRVEAGPVDVVTTVRWAVQAAEALDWVHRNEVIHRDVKPSNLGLTDRGEIRLLDFGVAAAGAPPRGLPPGWIEEAVGTLGYAAPELLRDPAGAGPAADVYGLGASLYELLSGRLPHELEGAETEEAFRRRLEGSPAPRPLDAAAAGLPGDLVAAIMKALEPAAERRWTRAADLSRAIARFAGAS